MWPKSHFFTKSQAFLTLQMWLFPALLQGVIVSKILSFSVCYLSFITILGGRQGEDYPPPPFHHINPPKPQEPVWGHPTHEWSPELASDVVPLPWSPCGATPLCCSPWDVHSINRQEGKQDNYLMDCHHEYNFLQKEFLVFLEVLLELTIYHRKGQLPQLRE